MHGLDFLAWIGAAVSLWGTARYVIGIGKGETQPRLASWIAWAAANCILMVVALQAGAQTAAIFNGLAGLGNVSVLIISAIKRAGERPQGATDWICLSTAGVCLLAILSFSHMTTLVAVLAMCANLVATWPTIQHAWQRPREETWQLFAANGGANALGLVSVVSASGMALGNIAGPLISMFGNVGLVVITVGRSWLTRTVEEVEEEVREMVEEVEEEVREIQDSLGKPRTAAPKRPKLIRSY